MDSDVMNTVITRKKKEKKRKTPAGAKIIASNQGRTKPRGYRPEK
jgi:hypothetical protein